MKLCFIFLVTVFSAASAQKGLLDLKKNQGELDNREASVSELPLEFILEAFGDSLFLPGTNRSHILWDRNGIPHIYGETDVDVAFGFGYAQAEDHLISMLMNYRQARGELSEIRGDGFLEADYKALLWRIHRIAGERYGSIPKQTRRLIEGFSKGINHYIEVHQNVLPSWVEPVNSVDIVAFSNWINFLFSEYSGRSELAQKGLNPILGSKLGSSQWAIGPSRSASGTPILVMDPHFLWDLPFLWYEAHLASQEGLDVVGATFFGLPFIFMGHNNRIAWSLMVNEVDGFDLYEERLDPSNPKRYFYEKEKYRISSRRVKIRVQREGRVVDVERELLYTHHGPIYKMTKDWAYSARSSATDVLGNFDQFNAINRAESLEEFRQAMNLLQLPMFNVMYADVEGNTFYAFNGRCPVRSENFDWRLVVPGWTRETEWGKIIPFRQLPSVTNPTSGFLQNCNVAPDLVTVESGLDSSSFPAYLGWGQINDRGRRLLSWLSSHQQITVRETIQLSRDQYLIAAEELKGLILRAYNRTGHKIYDLDGKLAESVDLLRTWDGRATVESLGSLFFSVWKKRFDSLIEQISIDQRRDSLLLEKLALEELRTTVEYFLRVYGRLDVPWGEVHVIERGNQRFPVGGSPPGTQALHTTWSDLGNDGVLRVKGGSSFTMTVALERAIKAWSLLPFGNSEDPTSIHYSDQAAMQSQNRFKRIWFRKDEIYPNLERVVAVPLNPLEAERATLRDLFRVRQENGLIMPNFEIEDGTQEEQNPNIQESGPKDSGQKSLEKSR